MMGKDDILRRLAELNISHTTYEHHPVMTSADLANVCTPSTPLHPISYLADPPSAGCLDMTAS